MIRTFFCCPQSKAVEKYQIYILKFTIVNNKNLSEKTFVMTKATGFIITIFLNNNHLLKTKITIHVIAKSVPCTKSVIPQNLKIIKNKNMKSENFNTKSRKF